jgi:xanthine dehydrogenase molybdopterin-binding subunit B
MLAISVHEALTNAVAATSKNRRLPKLNAPATPERILKTIKWLQDDTD